VKLASRAVLGSFAALLVFGCQGIAGVEDVHYDGNGLSCASYCKTVMEACPGDSAVYVDQAACEEVCALFAPGNTDSPEGNTLACRAQQADVALQFSSDPGESRTNCAAAGPGGDKTCTVYEDEPDCEGYCKIYMKACPMKNWGFKNEQQCIDRCAAFARPTSFSVAEGLEGDSLSCRLQHATLALESPDRECESAGQLPSVDCAGSGEAECDDYCRVNRTACTGEFAVYENPRQCQAVCNATRKGDRARDTGGQDSVACRLYHSYFALGQPSPHCSHSGPTGDKICSDDGENHPNCVAFCRLFEQACERQFGDVYGGDDDVCVSECEKLDDAGADMLYSIQAAQSGDTLKCRALAVVRALTEPLSPDTPSRCEAALGGDPCN